MPRMKVSHQYYTAAEVKEKLNITQGELYNYVRNGTLKPVVPPGKRQGVYLRSEVEELAREQFAFMAMQAKTSSTFIKATEEDVKEIEKDMKSTVEITRVLFGLRENSEATLARRLTWIEKNPDIFYILKSEDQVVGYTAMLPLKPEKIMNILDGIEYSQEINAEEIEAFEPGKPAHIYFLGIGVTPAASHFEKRSYGSRLVSGLMKTIINLGKRGIIIEQLYARSDTPDGIRLMRKFGFTEVPSKTHARNFTIKIEESGIPFIVEYKEALKEYKGAKTKSDEDTRSSKHKQTVKPLQS
jgi:ribosomal protein S18 acetylase RimI-like enzyme